MVEVIEKLKKFFDENDTHYSKGISEEEAAVLSSRCMDELGFEIPIEYVEFLKKMNGFDYDGRRMFGFVTDELKNTNREISDFFKWNNEYGGMDSSREGGWLGQDYIFMGEGSCHTYIAMDMRTRKIVKLGTVCFEEEGEYTSFEEMLDGFFLGVFEER